MTLDQLQVLDSIIKSGSFRAASEDLHRAQSAISYAIKNLENEMGIKIFTRETYRPQLTLQGKAFYDRSLRLLNNADGLKKLGEQLSLGKEPLLKIAVSAPFPIEPLICAFHEFNNSEIHTQLKLNIEVLGTHLRLLKGQADIAITELPITQQNQFEYEFLKKVPLIPVVGIKHKLAKMKNNFLEEDLLEHVHIILESTREETKDQKAGIPDGGQVWSVTDFLTKKNLLLGGLGWGYMPLHLVNEDINKENLIVLNVKEYKELSIDFYLARKMNSVIGPNAQLLWGKIKKLCK